MVDSYGVPFALPQKTNRMRVRVPVVLPLYAIGIGQSCPVDSGTGQPSPLYVPPNRREIPHAPQNGANLTVGAAAVIPDATSDSDS
jgi:hypothetical protein